MGETTNSDAAFLEDCAIHLTELERRLDAHVATTRNDTLLAGLPRPASLAHAMRKRAALARDRAVHFWTMLDVSLAHLHMSDVELLQGYEGPDEALESHRAAGQSLFVTPCAHGWIISTSGCLAPGGIAPALDVDRNELARSREETIADMRREGFSEDFIALFRFGYENGASDIRFHQDAEPLLGFSCPGFDLEEDRARPSPR